MRFGVGLAAFFVIAQIPPHYLRIFTPWMYLLGIGLLLVVAVEGADRQGRAALARSRRRDGSSRRSC